MLHSKEYYKKNYEFYKAAYRLKLGELNELEKENNRLVKLIEKMESEIWKKSQ